MKPKLFIASSVEGLPVAEAVKQHLSNDAEITIWAEAFFNLSRTPVENFTSALNDFDFSIFIIAPDDSLRDRKAPAPRDNIILEMGMFIGRLGKNRTFLGSGSLRGESQ